MMTATIAAACSSALASASAMLGPPRPSSTTPNRTGATMRSWNSSSDSAMRPTGGADHQRRQHELQGADAGDVAPQRPQPRHRQLETDQEEEKQHAELGERLD